MAKLREEEQAIRIVTWEEYDQLLEKLVKDMDYDSSMTSSVYGIPRGGLIVATCITHIDNFLLYLNDPLPNNYQQDHLVIVDDIVDSGKTAQPYYEIGEIACLFYREGASFEPDYYAEKLETDVWIRFPWERSV